jgi:hypothetical protein
MTRQNFAKFRKLLLQICNTDAGVILNGVAPLWGLVLKLPQRLKHSWCRVRMRDAWDPWVLAADAGRGYGI